MQAALASLLQDPRVWRGGTHARQFDTVPAGRAALDALLPDGWPLGALVELLVARAGCGEVGLLLPVLARLAQAGRSTVWIGAPYPPYAPALAAAGVDPAWVWCVAAEPRARRVWAAEQVLQSGASGAVLLWLERVPGRELKRLQLAAAGSGTLLVLLRPAAAAGQPSPAVLRLRLEPAEGGVKVQRLKPLGGSTQVLCKLPGAGA